MNNEREPKLASRRAVSARRSCRAAPRRSARSSPRAAESNPANLPPNVADWTKMLGEGVAARPYGKRAKYEEHIVRRDVSWLTASPQSSVSFTPLHEIDGIITPNGLCFERHHSGIAEVNPADYRLMIHGLVDKPLIFTLDDIKRMPRVNRAYFCECAANSGMEWRGAQLNGAQYTHGMVHCVMYTGVPLKVLLNEAGLKPKAKWLLLEGGDAAAMTRSLPLAQGARRRARRLPHERRDALPRERLSGAHGAAGLGGQHVGEVAAPHRGRRPALAHPRGDLEVHRPDGERPGAALHLSDGGQIRHHQSEPAGADQSQVRLHGAVRHRLVRPRQDRARRRLARRRPQLARRAKIDGPAWDKALARFYFEFDWDGSELLLQSRAMDESGYVQPSKAELRKIRGVNSIYHNNGIQTWHVQKNGEVENVEVS